MSLIRNDIQLALNDLVVAVKELADHYQDSADFLGDNAIGPYLEQFAKRHFSLASRVDRAIRAEDDLPSTPDPEHEAGEFLFEHLSASLSKDEVEKIIEQRLKEEKELSELIEKAKSAGLGESHKTLLTDLEESNHLIIENLHELLKRHSG